MFAVHVTRYCYRGTLNRPDDGLLRDDRRCNRDLTTPESVASGIGPTCAEKEMGEN